VTQNILHFSPLPVTQTARLNSPGSILFEAFLHSSETAGFPAYLLDNFQIFYLLDLKFPLHFFPVYGINFF
jgi:hypothetical protein